MYFVTSTQKGCVRFRPFHARRYGRAVQFLDGSQ
jgi:hypothetical protein